MSHRFYLDESDSRRVVVNHLVQVIDSSMQRTYRPPTHGPDYLIANIDDSGMWFVDFQDEDGKQTYFESKAEAIGAIVQSMIERISS